MKIRFNTLKNFKMITTLFFFPVVLRVPLLATSEYAHEYRAGT